MNPCVSRHRGADIDPDGGGIHEFHVCDALGFDRADLCGQGSAVDGCLQRRNKTFQHHGGLAGAGYPGDHREPPFGNLHLQRLDRVDLRSGQMDRAVCKQRFFFGARALLRLSLAGKKWPDLRCWVFFYGGNGSLCDHVAALCAGFRPHFDDPVGLP